MLLSLLYTFLLYVISHADIIIPAPNGTYGVGLKIMELVDTSRVDLSQLPPTDRRILISAFYPNSEAAECNSTLTPYMPNQTATIVAQDFGLTPATYQALRLSVCQLNLAATVLTKFPLVLFSPAWGTSRLLYSVIAQTIASHGYVVVTIDHPGDADVVEYPDGTLSLASLPNPQYDTSAGWPEVNTRVQDVEFVLDHLQSSCDDALSLPISGSGNPVVFGHSLGGATAAAAMLNDSRIVGGIDLDGELIGPVLDDGLENPFLIFASEQNSNPPMSSWNQIRPRLHWNQALELLNSTHYTFSDLPLLAELVIPGPLPASITSKLGSLSGSRALNITTQYVSAFLEETLKCQPSALLQRPSEQYPEILFRL